MSAELINSVIAQGHRLATHSWEYGTFSEALLEWHTPQYSVFGSDPFPNGKVPVLQVGDVQALSYAKPYIWTNQSTLVNGDGESASYLSCSRCSHGGVSRGQSSPCLSGVLYIPGRDGNI